MLLAREKKIVTLLIEHEDKLTTTQIATSLKVSSRTIKADIKKINEELEKHSCRINSQQGVGLWIEYDNHEAKKYLKEVTRDTADLYLSPEVRKYHLAVELLLQDDYTSMEALAKEYYISKATDLMRHATNASIATLKENPQIDYMDLCIAVEDAMKDFIKSYMRVIGSSGRYSFEKHNGPELD